MWRVVMFWLRKNRENQIRVLLKKHILEVKKNNKKIGIFVDMSLSPKDVNWVDIPYIDEKIWLVVRNKKSFMEVLKYIYDLGIPVENVYLSIDNINNHNLVMSMMTYLNKNNLEAPPKKNIIYHSKNYGHKPEVKSCIHNYCTGIDTNMIAA